MNWQFHVLPPSRDSYIESLLTMICHRIGGVRLDLVERVRRLRPGHIDAVRVSLLPRSPAILASIHLVAHRSAGAPTSTSAATGCALRRRTRVRARGHAFLARVQVLDDDGQHVRVLRTEVEADAADIA